LHYAIYYNKLIIILEEKLKMVKIRLRRMGAKKNPYYRVIVADSKSPRDGRFIEEIGTYDPLASPSLIKIDLERADYWVKNGAQPTETVRALLKKAAVRTEKAETADE
jgi:small subunit ribosomal protein S16